MDVLCEDNFCNSAFIYCSNSPILFVDSDGSDDAPIYDTEGNFLGVDDKGLQGKAIVMSKEDFQLGMGHKEALSKNKGYEGLVSSEAGVKLLKHYNNLPNRPDYDGIIDFKEGIEWAKSHPEAKNHKTPDNMLYADASKLNFGYLSINSFISDKQPVNLFPTDLSVMSELKAMSALYVRSILNTTYALGRFDAEVTDRTNKKISIVDNEATVYDWNYGGSIIRNLFIFNERRLHNLTDNHGFNVFYYGEGKLLF